MPTVCGGKGTNSKTWLLLTRPICRKVSAFCGSSSDNPTCFNQQLKVERSVAKWTRSNDPHSNSAQKCNLDGWRCFGCSYPFTLHKKGSNQQNTPNHPLRVTQVTITACWAVPRSLDTGKSCCWGGCWQSRNLPPLPLTGGLAKTCTCYFPWRFPFRRVAQDGPPGRDSFLGQI